MVFCAAKDTSKLLFRFLKVGRNKRKMSIVSFNSAARGAQDRLMECDKTFTVAIEGNIGSGKTTFLQHFMNIPSAMVLPEPVQSWRNVEGHNLLNLMYSDSEKWSFAFQSYVQLTMYQLHQRKLEFCKKVKLMERSIFSARYCFVENLYHCGRLLDPEYVVLSKWYDYLTSDEKVSLDLIVYLRTSPKTAYQRIQKRNRVEEKSITMEYLEQLHDLHEDLLYRRTFQTPCSVLVLDADCSLEELKNLCVKHEAAILLPSHQS